MSNHSLFVKSTFINTSSQNGVGRYVCQLKQIVVKFCKSHGSSRGMRDFIETELLHFAKANPGVVVYLKPRRHRGPHIVGEYLNGDKQHVYCANKEKDEICKWLNLLKSQSHNNEGTRLRKLIHTNSPSIQGPWTPYTFRDPSINLENFPSKNLSKKLDEPETATEKLLELFKKQCQLKESDVKQLE